MRPIVLLLGLALAACSPGPAASPSTSLGIENDTTLVLSLVVNGQTAATLPPGGSEESGANLPARPWTVEARTASGRVLATMFVGLGPADPAVAGDSSTSGSSAQFPLSCGSIRMWTGNAPAADDAEASDASSLPNCAGG
jgi:hypothetical protein